MPAPALMAIGCVIVVVALLVVLLRGWPPVACNADLVAFLGSLVLLLPTVANEAMKWRKAQLDAAIATAELHNDASRNRLNAQSATLGEAIAAFAPWHATVLALGLLLVSLGFGLGAFGVAACPA